MLVDFIVYVIAFISSLLFVCNILSTLTLDPVQVVQNKDLVDSFARFRLVLVLIMSIAWSYLIVW